MGGMRGHYTVNVLAGDQVRERGGRYKCGKNKVHVLCVRVVLVDANDGEGASFRWRELVRRAVYIRTTLGLRVRT